MCRRRSGCDGDEARRLRRPPPTAMSAAEPCGRRGRSLRSGIRVSAPGETQLRLPLSLYQPSQMLSTCRPFMAAPLHAKSFSSSEDGQTGLCCAARLKMEEHSTGGGEADEEIAAAVEVRGARGRWQLVEPAQLIAAGAELGSSADSRAHVTATRNGASFKSPAQRSRMDWPEASRGRGRAREARQGGLRRGARPCACGGAERAEAEAAARKAVRADLEQQDSEWRAARAAEIRAADIRPRVTPVTSAKSRRRGSRRPSRSASSAASGRSTRPPSAPLGGRRAASGSASPTEPAPSPTRLSASPPSRRRRPPSRRRARGAPPAAAASRCSRSSRTWARSCARRSSRRAAASRSSSSRSPSGSEARVAAKALRDGDVAVSAEARIVDRGLFAWNPPSGKSPAELARVNSLVSSLD